MAHISTLIPDVQELLTTKDWFTESLANEFAHSLALRLREQFASRTGPGTLRLSRMGPQCPCALWYSVRHPELAERMPPWAENKFSFGHMIEVWAITLAKAAGHTVEGEQDEVSVDGILGHRDCIVDGCLVDVKSAASRSFSKFKDGSLVHDDLFGYLDQLDGYLVGCLEDPLVTVKDRGYLWAIDKQLGHMCLYEHLHTPSRKEQITSRIRHSKDIVRLREPPPCECGTITDEGSGNIRLDVRGSYNAYKYCCFPRLRTFIYSGGPEYFVKVVKPPRNKNGPLTEVDKHGKIVYN